MAAKSKERANELDSMGFPLFEKTRNANTINAVARIPRMPLTSVVRRANLTRRGEFRLDNYGYV